MEELKKQAKNIDKTVEVLFSFAHEFATKMVKEIETDKFYETIGKKFNDQPAIKRQIDIMVINIWLASLSVRLYYEEIDSKKIINKLVADLYKNYEIYENKMIEKGELLTIPLKDFFIKDKDELDVFCQQYNFKEVTMTNFLTILDVIIPKRFTDYENARFKSQSYGVKEIAGLNMVAVAQCFNKHIYGEEVGDFDSIIGCSIWAHIFINTFKDCSQCIRKIESNSK